MSTVYSRLLFQGHVAPGNDVAVPADPGSVMVVRDIDCYGVGDPELGLAIHIKDNDSGVTFAFGNKLPSDADLRFYFAWRGRQVFETTSLGFDVAGAEIDVRVSGYMLTL